MKDTIMQNSEIVKNLSDISQKKKKQTVSITPSLQQTPNVSTSSMNRKTLNVNDVYFIFSRQSQNTYNCEISSRNNFTVTIKVSKSAGADYFGEPQFVPVFDMKLKDGKKEAKKRLFLKKGDRIHIEIIGKDYIKQESFTL